MAEIKICITIDWEGEDLLGVDGLARMRKQFKDDIPVTHFICPNYFTKPAESKRAAEIIWQFIRPEDEIGLHIHCYRKLIESIPGVHFRNDLNYHNVPGRLRRIIGKRIPWILPEITGRGVPLTVYPVEEMERILNHSKLLLMNSLNLKELSGFRAGGWLTNDLLLDLTKKAGFHYDSSAVPPAIFSKGYSSTDKGNMVDDYGDNNGLFTQLLLSVWGNTKNTGSFSINSNILAANNNKAVSVGSQPYYIGSLLEIPNNFALSDFALPEVTVMPLVKKYLKELETRPEGDFVIVYGCHQEGDWNYKLPLIRFVREIKRLNHPLIRFCTLNEVAGK